MLSDDLIRWFDQELWRIVDQQQTDRYASPISASDLLVDAPAAIWPALMPCDFLPLVGNQMGDWLCLRMAEEPGASQVVQWYHGGGDWIPWGNDLAEAIFFDSVRQRLPGSQRDHAVAATIPDPGAPSGSANRLANWAENELRDRSVRDLSTLRGLDLATAMLDRGLCVPAVLCQLVIDALDNPQLDSDCIRDWDIDDPNEVQRWLFDNRLIPDELLQRYAGGRERAESIAAQQDWQAVERYSRQATEAAPELAWGWDLLGYVNERRGDVSTAIAAYRRGLSCSIFTDQTVRVRTHGFSGDGQKFSAARLAALEFVPDDAEHLKYFRLLCDCSDDERRDRVREYFSDLARRESGAASHDLWKRAGWDLGAEPMAAFADLLEQVAAAAESAARPAQAALAQTHRNCFRDRYGI